jgi:hypothetical protein
LLDFADPPVRFDTTATKAVTTTAARASFTNVLGEGRRRFGSVTSDKNVNLQSDNQSNQIRIG